MGIPGILQWIKNNFEGHYEVLTSGTDQKTVDVVHIDANSLIYNAISIVYPDSKVKNVYESFTEKEKDTKIYELFFEEMKNLIKIVVPKKKLVIAIDGPAPIAKQRQQRWRRFRNSYNPETDTNIKFNHAQVSPGTLFMHNLMKYINYSIRKIMCSVNPIDAHWKNIEVLFSPCTIPGEGEHKCLDYIKKYKVDKPNDSHCMIGNDNDLIMLSMAAHIDNIYILKQEIDNESRSAKFIYLDIFKIATKLPSVFGLNGHISREQCVNDFIVGAFFVGNDFLPMIPMFENLSQGIFKTMKTYAFSYKKNNQSLTKDKKINLEGLKFFLFYIKNYESSYLLERYKFSIQRPSEDKFKDTTLSNSIAREGNGFRLDIKKYKKLYYKRFGIEKSQLKNLCRDYIKTLVWVFNYYLLSLESWTWSYDYHYTPLMYDLYQFLVNISPEDEHYIFNFDSDRPNLPFEQLLNILPSKFSYILPKQYARLMTDENSPLVKKGYYPSEFVIDYEGKKKDHEGRVLIPFIPNGEIQEAYEKMSNCCVNIEKYNRNRQGKYYESYPLFYSFMYNSQAKPYNYISDYGRIVGAYVDKTEVYK